MQCPKCKSDSSILDIRYREDGAARRRRKCKKCGERWTTFEIILDKGDKNYKHSDRILEQVKAKIEELKKLLE